MEECPPAKTSFPEFHNSIPPGVTNCHKMRRQKKSAKEACAGATHIRSFWLEVFWDLTVCQCVTLDCDYKRNAKDIATQPANRTYLKDIKIVSTFYRLMLCVKSSFKKLFLNCTFRNAYATCIFLSRKRTC